MSLFEYILLKLFVHLFRTLVLALHVWLDSYPEDFRDPPRHPTLHQLLYFAQQYLPESELEVKVRHRLERFNREDQLLGKISFSYF